ncbi:MAG: Por Secre tail protein, partial [Bacteroidota bacterium]|nr:Por Secre tail protein [Bacteroidota bacterium]
YLNCSIKNNYVLSLKTIDLKFGSIYFFIDSLKSPFELANGEVSDFRVGFSGNSIGTYYDTLYATDGSGNSILAFAIANVTQPTGIEENKNENYSIVIIPQPAGDDAELKIALTESAIVNIKISDILGSTVMNVVNNEIMARGNHSLPINLRGNSNGFYIVHLQVGGVWISRRFILLR